MEQINNIKYDNQTIRILEEIDGGYVGYSIIDGGIVYVPKYVIKK